MTITVSMPYWRSPDTIRRAVEGVLDQTHRDLRLVVVNDGDHETPPWPHLDDIDDPRLVRFDLPENRGRYWCDAVTLAACQTPWWSPHDADDWSEPTRYEAHLATGADVSFCHARYFNLDGSIVDSPVRSHIVPEPNRVRTIARYPAGVWATEAVRATGGPNPDFRGSYDTVVVLLSWARFSPVVVDEYLYHVHKRPDSLTTARKTRQSTPWRRDQQRRARHIYNRALPATVDQWPSAGRPSTRSTRDAVRADTRRLAATLEALEAR